MSVTLTEISRSKVSLTEVDLWFILIIVAPKVLIKKIFFKFTFLQILFGCILAIVRKSPIRIVLWLIWSAFFLGLRSWFRFSKWLGFRIILIYLGGIMVIFLYITFLATNLKITLPKKNKIITLVILVLRLTPIPLQYIDVKDNIPLSLYKLINNQILLFLIVYLLLTLLVAVKLTENFKGALIKKF